MGFGVWGLGFGVWGLKTGVYLIEKDDARLMRSRARKHLADIPLALPHIHVAIVTKTNWLQLAFAYILISSGPFTLRKWQPD